MTRTQPTTLTKNQRFGLLLGPLLCGVLLLLPAPEAIGPDGWKVIAVATLMLSWWISEAVPIPVTALLPMVLFPALGIMDLNAATASYSHPIVFLFFGGFIIALAMQKWALHRRIALFIVRRTGTHASGIIAGFMLATAFLSMWMSNTATTVMMLPIALSVLSLIMQDRTPNQLNPNEHRFALTLMLGVAFAANIGGTATIIGTPPNAILIGFLQQEYDYTIPFATWFTFGFPFALTLLLLSWWLMSYIIYPSKLGLIKGAEDIINEEWRKLGKMSPAEARVAIVFFCTAVLWIGKDMLPFALTDTSIAMLAAISLFLIPSGNGDKLLRWEDTSSLPWGILFLFGGGLTLAGAMRDSGLVEVIGASVEGASALGLIGLVATTAGVVLILTEVMSNLALITVFLPVLAGMAIGFGENPLMLTIGATLASSCAFMLPMATPPNAIVFASGHIRVVEMVHAGIILNIVSILLITIFMFAIINVIVEIIPGTIPSWVIL